MFSFFKKKPPATQAPPLVVPRIKQTNFAVAIDNIPGMTAASRPVIEPLVGDLLLTYAIDIGPSYLSVSPGSLAENNLQQSDLRALAEPNAWAVLKGREVRTDGPVHILTADDNLAACSILFPEIWQQVEKELGGPVIAAFPHRDFVLYARAENAEALRSILGQVDFDETHALSQLLYQRVDGEWRVVAH